jgi:tetratricopeptide (TPR) repeat protein
MGLFDKKETEPVSAKDFLKRSQKHLKEKDYDKAIEDSTKAIELFTKKEIDGISDCQVVRGMSYFHKKNYELSIKDLGKVMSNYGPLHFKPAYDTLEKAKELLKYERRAQAKAENNAGAQQETAAAQGAAAQKLGATTGGVEE